MERLSTDHDSIPTIKAGLAVPSINEGLVSNKKQFYFKPCHTISRQHKNILYQSCVKKIIQKFNIN
jgi:hypothetical protein